MNKMIDGVCVGDSMYKCQEGIMQKVHQTTGVLGLCDICYSAPKDVMASRLTTAMGIGNSRV